MKSMRVAQATVVLACWLASCAPVGDAAEPEGASVEAIIAGTAATAYPEAATLNMPVTATTGYACSGTLIAPRVVLTAGHCVDGLTRFEVYVGATMVVSTTATTYDWNEHGATTVNPAHHDIGLVFLDTPIALAAYPTLAAAPLADGASVVDVGRILNGALTATAWQATDIVRDGTASGYPFDYAAADVIEHGDSGGPVFAAGSHTIVAVNSGAGSGLEVLARVDLLHAWLAAQIASHGGASLPATDAGTHADAGTAVADASVRDAGAAADAGVHDAAVTDSGARDAAVADSGARDAAVTDSGAHDAAVADSGAHDAAVTDSGARPDAAGSACAAATLPDDTLATAAALGTCTSGSLTAASHTAYLAFAATPGVTYALQLTAAADARFTLGVVTPGATGPTCAPLGTGLLAARVTVTGAARSVCVVVGSAAHAAQGYTLTRM